MQFPHNGLEEISYGLIIWLLHPFFHSFLFSFRQNQSGQPAQLFFMVRIFCPSSWRYSISSMLFFTI